MDKMDESADKQVKEKTYSANQEEKKHKDEESSSDEEEKLTPMEQKL